MADENELRTKKQRRTYVNTRIAELQKELEDLRNEKKKLNEEIGGVAREKE